MKSNKEFDVSGKVVAITGAAGELSHPPNIGREVGDGGLWLEIPVRIGLRQEGQLLVPDFSPGNLQREQDGLFIRQVGLDVTPAKAPQPGDRLFPRANGQGGQEGVRRPAQPGLVAQVAAWGVEELRITAEGIKRETSIFKRWGNIHFNERLSFGCLRIVGVGI